MGISKNFSRRDFLKVSSVAGLGPRLPPSLLDVHLQYRLIMIYQQQID